MKRMRILFCLILIVAAGGANVATAQFPIKIPKFGKPKTEQTKPETPPTAQPNAGENSPTTKTNQDKYLSKPEPDSVVRFQPASLEIKAKNEPRYWKTPNQNDNPSWYPQVAFELFYRSDTRLRLIAEYFNPDGSLWFSEGLENNDGYVTRSPNVDDWVEKKSVQAVGTFGVKITDTRTGIVHFQGKFKVVKLPLDPTQAPKHMFYVENDWNLPIGYVGFEGDHTDYKVRTRPMAFFWFKGNLSSRQFEAELYYNNQRVATTDKGGNINSIAKRGEECYLKPDLCLYSLYRFEWENVLIDNSPIARQNSPNGYFLNDKPGEYTVKIFYQGEQAREAKFTVDQRGWIARNAFSGQIHLSDHRVAVPVKVMGDIEKWNPATWKTDAFYGNPLNGFVAP